MTISRRQLFAAGLLSALPAWPAMAAPADPQRIVTDRAAALSAGRNSLGLVVGVLDAGGRRVVAAGHRSANAAAPDAQTLFEIGSLTKAFTALLLARMADQGEVALSDPVAALLPDLPFKTTTLLDLATHTSGLPFMPEGAPATPADLHRAVAGIAPTAGAWDYSNLGYWLLGEALAARAGKPFEALLAERILRALNLRRTGFAPVDGNRAVGLDASLRPAPAFAAAAPYSLMPAAGGLWSCADDLLTLAEAGLGLRATPLARALVLSTTTRRPVGTPGREQALGWTIVDGQIVFRDGGTMGHSSCLAWDSAVGRAVVALQNQTTSVADIALHLLRPSYPLASPRTVLRQEIAVDPVVLATYAGRYDTGDEGVFEILLKDGALVVQAPADWGLPPLVLHAETPEAFFAAELPLRIVFQAEGGQVTGILIHPPRGQKAIPAGRLP